MPTPPLSDKVPAWLCFSRAVAEWRVLCVAESSLDERAGGQGTNSWPEVHQVPHAAVDQAALGCGQEEPA